MGRGPRTYPADIDVCGLDVADALNAALTGRERGASIVHTYPGAEHGFSSRARQSKPVNAEAYLHSWPQSLSFVRTTTLR